MAIVGGQQDEELQNGQPAQPAGSTGGGAFVGGGSGQGATTKTATAPTSSGYTNLSSYLQANQGTGATTGQAAENVVGQAGSKATEADARYGTLAGNDVAKAEQSVGPDYSTLENIKSGKVNAKNAQVAYGANAPTAGTVAGSTVINNLDSDATAAQSDATAANSDLMDKAGSKGAQGGQAGVAGLLRNAYQQPNYTAGENNLDSFLAGGTPGGQKALGQAAGVAKGVTNSYAKINNALGDRINAAHDQVADTNNQYNNAYVPPPPEKGVGSAGAAMVASNKPSAVSPVAAPKAVNPAPVSTPQSQPTAAKPSAVGAMGQAIKTSVTNPVKSAKDVANAITHPAPITTNHIFDHVGAPHDLFSKYGKYFHPRAPVANDPATHAVEHAVTQPAPISGYSQVTNALEQAAKNSQPQNIYKKVSKYL